LNNMMDNEPHLKNKLNFNRDKLIVYINPI
jgi:hypothetical protein